MRANSWLTQNIVFSWMSLGPLTSPSATKTWRLILGKNSNDWNKCYKQWIIIVPGLRLTTRQLANGECVHGSGEWRLLSYSPVWWVIHFRVLHEKQQLLWIEHGHIAYQWKTNQIFNSVVSLHLHEIVEGLYFLLQFVCVCVCLCVRNSCEQNSSRTDAPIWMQFSLNGCLSHWLEPYWNGWPWVKGQGHCDRKCM